MVRIISVHETYGRIKYKILKAVIILCDSFGEALRALVTNPIAKDYFSRPRLEISGDEAHQDGYLR